MQDSFKTIHADQYDAVREYIKSYQSKLPDQVIQSQDYCFRAFLIPKLGNHANSSDIAIEFVRYDPENEDEMKLYEKQVAFIKEKIVQAADQGKFLPKTVVEMIQDRTGKQDFSVHLHTKAWKLFQVRTSTPTPSTCKTKYCQYNEAFKQVVYTQAWVDFLCEKVLDPVEFERIKHYR